MIANNSSNVTLFNSICNGNATYFSCGLDLAGRGVAVVSHVGEQYVGAQLVHAVAAAAGTTLLSWAGQFANFFFGNRFLARQVAIVDRHKVKAIGDSIAAIAGSSLLSTRVTTNAGRLGVKAVQRILTQAGEGIKQKKCSEEALCVVGEADRQIQTEINDRVEGIRDRGTRNELQTLRVAVRDRIAEARQGGARTPGDDLSVQEECLKESRNRVSSGKPSLKRAAVHGLFAGGIAYGAEAALQANWTAALEYAAPFGSAVDSLIGSITNRQNLKTRRELVVLWMDVFVAIQKELRIQKNSRNPTDKEQEKIAILTPLLDVEWEEEGRNYVLNEASDGEILEIKKEIEPVVKELHNTLMNLSPRYEAFFGAL